MKVSSDCMKKERGFIELGKYGIYDYKYSLIKG
jgi:hypothetical protein